MTFVTALALLIAGLVTLPVVAHRLRRMRADEKIFAAARLVPKAQPRARRRAKLEDRGLFAVRAAAIVLLAVLGASPFVRCTRLSMQRSGGASVAVAIVMDDSMSMRVMQGSATRFEKSRASALELLASMREGDAVAVVLAGSPSRVALAATTDLDAARSALEGVTQSDRATDLDGALELSRGLLAQLPQLDKRVVLLSDLADGDPQAAPIGESSRVPVWAPLEDIRGAVSDCGIVAADRAGDHVKVTGACAPGSSAQGRDVAIVSGESRLAHVAAGTGSTFEVTLSLPKDAPAELSAKLEGTDSVPSDDTAPVLVAQGPAAIAVIAETSDESVATGGAPVLEQALAALRVDLPVRPLPSIPDRDEDLAPFVAIVMDDPPGLTPEQRRAVEKFFERGGAVLLALGPRASQAPLGASLQPVLGHGIVWSKTPVPGADPATAKSGLDESATSLVDLAATNRATLDNGDLSAMETLLAWKDGAPLFAYRAIGRGEAWVSTLPFAVDASDLVLRPGFLALLDAFVERARVHAAAPRGDVGVPWPFAGANHVSAEGPSGTVASSRERGTLAIVPSLIGAYRIDVDGQKELHVAAPIAREMDTRPRTLAPAAAASSLGDTHAQVDASPAIAVLLLLLLTAELAFRLWGQRERSGVTGA